MPASSWPTNTAAILMLKTPPTSWGSTESSPDRAFLLLKNVFIDCGFFFSTYRVISIKNYHPKIRIITQMLQYHNKVRPNLGAIHISSHQGHVSICGVKLERLSWGGGWGGNSSILWAPVNSSLACCFIFLFGAQAPGNGKILSESHSLSKPIVIFKPSTSADIFTSACILTKTIIILKILIQNFQTFSHLLPLEA